MSRSKYNEKGFSRRKNHQNESVTRVEERFRITTQSKIDNFLQDEHQNELSFPPSLTKDERAFIHVYIEDKNLKSKSHNKGVERFITIYKQLGGTHVQRDAAFELTHVSQQEIYLLLKNYPLTSKEIHDVTTADSGKIKQNIIPFRLSVGSAKKTYLCVPPLHKNNDFIESRQNLPIYNYRREILESINKNQVVVVAGETGSGKSTQVPQYILEDCSTKNEQCRIICTQPRRLSAISVAERVNLERGEVIGQVVGYQIRLESLTSPTSNLIYCTNGLFLRCLMGDYNQEIYKTITHIIVDEVHERDKHSDFLLISIREALKTNPKIKLILMSATMDSNVFTEYFGNCPLMNIPGRMFPVKQYFLDQILALTGYTNDKIEKFKKKMFDADTNNQNQITESFIEKQQQQPTEINSEIVLDIETIELLNETMDACLENEDEFSQFFYLVEGENVPVNYQNTKNGLTALIIAATKGYQEIIHKLLYLGADSKIKCFQGLNAIDWAAKTQQYECVAILSDAITEDPLNDLNLQFETILLDNYHKTINDDVIDHNLIMNLINYIHTTQPFGGILIFLPGYDDIIEQNEIIQTNLQLSEICNNYEIYMLHSNMNLSDQKGVFRPSAFGCRKIILSTNIAETSVTIDDVVYVIDSGKVKQKSFDAISGTTCLIPTWISQACATQRSGRAGRTRPGNCYKMYSKLRYDTMEKYTLPEILRVPLTEICLQSKLVAPNISVCDFLNKALQPPSPLSVKQSLRLLISIGALTVNENLTELGILLADLPVDAQLGKTLIYSILLKCLDPILTIVSSLSVKDPFVLPSQISDRSRAVLIKKSLSENSFSDHMALLKVFQKWLTYKANKTDKKFCHQNFISAGNMETICGVRSQILGHLRAVGLIRSYGSGNIHELNVNSNNWAVVKACLVGALYPNVCRLDRDNGVLKSKLDKKVLIHPSSILRNNKLKKVDFSVFPSDWVVFGEKTRVGRYSFIKTNTIVSPITISLFAGTIVQNEDTSLVPLQDYSYNDDEQFEDTATGGEGEVSFGGKFSEQRKPLTNLILDDWIKFTLDTDTAYMVFHLRQKLSALFLKFIRDPKLYYKIERDSHVIQTVIDILSIEDRALNLPQPNGVGDRPKAVMLNFSANVNFGIPDNDTSLELSSQMYNTNFSIDSNQSSSHSTRSNNFYPEYKINAGRPITKKDDRRSQQYQHQPQQQQQPKIFVPTFLSNERKFFIIKAASKAQVSKSIETNRWNFASSVLKFLINHARQRPGVDFIIIFHVITSNSFVGLCKFYVLNDGWGLEWLSQNEIPFAQAKNSIPRFINGHEMRKIDKFYDGEELNYEVGNLFTNLFFQQYT